LIAICIQDVIRAQSFINHSWTAALCNDVDRFGGPLPTNLNESAAHRDAVFKQINRAYDYFRNHPFTVIFSIYLYNLIYTQIFHSCLQRTTVDQGSKRNLPVLQEMNELFTYSIRGINKNITLWFQVNDPFPTLKKKLLRRGIFT
jgi:hypothetical protein